MRVLVTGGAGYIGSHVALSLLEQGHEVTVLDNVSTGFSCLVPKGARFVHADLAEKDVVEKTLREDKIEAVMHMAAAAVVSESASDPGKYFRNNVTYAQNLLDAMVAVGVKRLIFSSSCAVYGTPKKVPIDESHPFAPISTYGWTKLMFERMLQAYGRAHGIEHVSLRYFNAAGAALDSSIGEMHDPETHLIPNVLKVSTGEKERLEVYGKDYPTEDGTCIRDYVHILDIARAHVLAMEKMDGGISPAYNIGTGDGHSVLSVIEMSRKVSGKDIPVHYADRRPGDPPRLVASSGLIKKELGWSPRFDLKKIIETAWDWESRDKGERHA
ncbi:MAG: UDP-glucose 4-epimerase GalE [archaeon]